MLYVIAIIDNDSEKKLNKLSKMPQELNVEPWNFHGHFTLLRYVGEDEFTFVNDCKNILKKYKSFSVKSNEVKMMFPTPSIAVSLVFDDKLKELFNELYEVAPNDFDQWSTKELYCPHITLFYNTEIDLNPIYERINEEFSSMEVKVLRIEFSKLTDNGFEIIDYIEL